MGRRRNKSGQVWRAKVARVAKSVTLRNLETKRQGLTLVTQNLLQPAGLATAPYTFRPTDSFVQGVEADDLIGREVILKGQRFNLSFTNVGTTNPDQQVTIRILCLKTDPYISGATGITYFVQGGTPDVSTWMLRTAKEPSSIIQKVYYDRTYTFNPHVAAQGLSKHIHINIDHHNMKWYRETNTTVIGSQYDIVWLVLTYVPGNVPANINAIMNWDHRIYYKDG